MSPSPAARHPAARSVIFASLFPIVMAACVQKQTVTMSVSFYVGQLCRSSHDVVDSDVTEAAAELTSVEITNDVVRERPAESHEPSTADAKHSVLLLSLSEVVVAVALLHCYCSALEGGGLALSAVQIS